MPLSSNSPRDIEIYVADLAAAPVYFRPFTIAKKPMGAQWRTHGIYITDTSKPAWMDLAGAWRYGDGTLV